MDSGKLNNKGISFYNEEGINIYYKDGMLTKREIGKAQEDIAIGSKTTFNYVIRLADNWIQTYESCL